MLALIMVSGCHHQSGEKVGEELSAAEVKVARVQARECAVTEDVVGTVRSSERAFVEAKVSGRVESVLVDLGQRVKSDELLARIDAQEVKARVDRANAEREQALKDWQRVQKLYDREVASKADFDAAEARYLAAEAALAEAKAMVGYVEVLAPFDGVVARRLVNAGDFAQPGKVLFELERPEVLRFETDVPEALIGFVRGGEDVEVEVPTLGRVIFGKVAEVAPAADAGSRTFAVRINLPNVEGLRAGQFGRAAIPIARQMSLWVPLSARVLRGQMEVVFVRSGGRAIMRLVRTGKVRDGEVEILSGLVEGEEIVVEGAGLLRDGQRLATRP